MILISFENQDSSAFNEHKVIYPDQLISEILLVNYENKTYFTPRIDLYL